MKIKLSDYIAKRLKEYHKVEHFFMVSGGGAMHLNDSLGREISYTANHHEQACAIAAEGYARVNQKLAVVNVTTGPGGLNCLNGVFGQWTDSVPVLYISGQVKYTTTIASCPEIPPRQLGDQEVDIISTVKHLTKYSKMVTEPNEIKYHLDKAIYEATTGRKGPVWLDIPMNIQAALIEEDELIEFIPNTLAPCGRGKDEGLNHSHRKYFPYTKEFARNLRKNQTPQEEKLWNILRNSQTGYKFRRQHQINNKYIADFICLENRLIIEVDGGQHFDSFKDTERIFYLNTEDFRILRFWNNEIDTNIDGCYEVILEELNTPHPNPLPQGAREPNPNLTQSLTNEVITKLKESKRPLIVAGHGIRLSGQIDNFNTLINKLNIPVVTTFNGFDLLEDNNSHYVGRIGTIGQRAGNFALQNADLVLCLGTRNNVRQASYNWENFAKNAYKIVVDIDEAELKKPLVKPDLAINADLADFIPELLQIYSPLVGEDTKKEVSFDTLAYCEQQQDKWCGNISLNTLAPCGRGKGEGYNSNWLEFCQNLKDKYSFINHPEQEQKPDVINPYHFTYTLTKCLNEDSIFVMANGSACVCAFQNAIIKKGQRYILNSGNASMGYGLPASIGACYDAKGRDVICLEGDGSIMMNLQELQTIKFNNLPIKLFVINNNGYSSIRQTQRNFFKGHMTGSGDDSGVSVPNFIEIGKAFGFKTKQISNPESMEKEIKEVLKEKDAIICEVLVEKEYGFAPKLSSKKLPDGTMISASLEDMFPFLDKDEYEGNIIQ